MGYFKNVLSGLSWLGGLRFSTRILTLLRIVILARILSPQEFGVFGIVTLVLGFLEILTETGVNLVLVQEKESTEKYINTAWVISIFRGFIIGVLIFVFTPSISRFFSSPDSLRLLYLVSLVPIVRGFVNPSVVNFVKKLQFNKEFSYRLSLFAVEIVSSVAIAVITRSSIALVYGLLVGAVAEVLIGFLWIKPKPKFSFDKEKLKFLLSQGKWITGFGIFDYLYTQGDNLIVGRLLGEYSLGIYQNAYKISLIPLSEFGDVLYKVTTPVFVQISEEKERLKRAFLKNVIFTSLVVSVVGILIYFFADRVVLLLLGASWIEAIQIVRILSILGILRGIGNSANSLFVSLKLQKYVTLTTFVSLVVLGLTVYPLTKTYGLIGASYSAILGTIFSLPITCYFVYKIFKK